MWDHTCSTNALRAGTSYSSPFELLAPTQMVFQVEGPDDLFCGEYSGTFPIPCTIQELLVDIHDSDIPMGNAELLHDCKTIHLRFDPDPRGGLNTSPFALRLFKPCVEKLVLIVDQERMAASYVEAVKEHERHPHLQITVITTYKVGQEAASKLRNKLVELIPAEISVRSFSKGRDYLCSA